MDSNKWTVAVGGVFNDGIQLKGLFDTSELATDWAEENAGDAEWCVVEIEKTDEED